VFVSQDFSKLADLTQTLSETKQRLSLRWFDRSTHRRLAELTQAVASNAVPDPDQSPVVFFRASSGILRLSLNAAFGLLSTWGLRLAGVPVVHFTCQEGMSRCIQGLNREDHLADPPCGACIDQSTRTYNGARVHGFDYHPAPALADALRGLRADELCAFQHDGLPLGELVTPSLRWALRRHHLEDDEPTRYTLKQFILSAQRVAERFDAMLDQVQPQAALIFNGTFFPEATARQVALRRGVRAITYEVGFQALSAFFTEGEATAYPIDIPDTFELSPRQEERLDAYLEARFQGKFTMAGIRFWPEMRGLDDAFLEKAAGFQQIVPVFTNVVFDTSQVHANTLFPHMFTWLDLILEIIHAHPETLFVIRAHPDEARAGKESQESVQDWVARNGLNTLPNVIFIAPDEFISSYELINRSKFVLVYNSSIGLEAALLGAAVVCGGNARYTRVATAYLPDSPRALRRRCEAFLAADRIEVPPAFRRNARRFMYYQLFRVSLPFEDYLEVDSYPGFVGLREFDWDRLRPEHSPAIQAVMEGVVNGRPFELKGDVGSP
jgi:hypothetical protein